MKKSLTQKMKNEVRILKTFLKSNGIYGAEIAKQGFSGYISSWHAGCMGRSRLTKPVMGQGSIGPGPSRVDNRQT